MQVILSQSYLTHGGMASVLGLVGPVIVCYDLARQQDWPAASVSVWQHTQ